MVTAELPSEHNLARQGEADQGGAGHDQVVRIDPRPRRQPAPGMQHHARTHLHRRTFAADRQPAEQAA
jgi:hypothetical protein